MRPPVFLCPFQPRIEKNTCDSAGMRRDECPVLRGQPSPLFFGNGAISKPTRRPLGSSLPIGIRGRRERLFLPYARAGVPDDRRRTYSADHDARSAVVLLLGSRVVLSRRRTSLSDSHFGIVYPAVGLYLADLRRRASERD